MNKELNNFIKSLETNIQKKKKYHKEDLKTIEIKIGFFQHERLVHLLVTLFFALFTIVFMGLCLVNYLFFFPFIILLVILIMYIIYYFYLENSVQYLYTLYDRILEISD